MSAKVIRLARAELAPPPVSLGPSQCAAEQRFWLGASGRRYVHCVYSLIECPPLPKAVFLLVHREPSGHRRVLHVGLGHSESATLNLAGVRQQGAQLGANEVHVHFSADSNAARALVVYDLRAGLIGELGPERRVSA